MKRNLYCFFIVLFIMAACQPSSTEQGQAGTVTQIATSTVKPTATLPPTNTPTPEISFEVNPNLPQVDLSEFVNNYEKYAKEFPQIPFDDVLSGKLIEQLQEHVQDNNIFGDDIVQNNIFLNYLDGFGDEKLGGKFYPWFVDIMPVAKTRKKPETRPFERISLFRIKDYQEFVDSIGVDPQKNVKNRYRPIGVTVSDENVDPIWIVAQGYHNPDNSITVTLSLTDIIDYIYVLDCIRNGKYGAPKGSEMYPIFYYDYRNVTMPEENIKKYNDFITYSLYKIYPQLKPDIKAIDEWIETKQMPKELQNSVFGYKPSWNFVW